MDDKLKIVRLKAIIADLFSVIERNDLYETIAMPELKRLMEEYKDDPSLK